MPLYSTQFLYETWHLPKSVVFETNSAYLLLVGNEMPV